MYVLLVPSWGKTVNYILRLVGCVDIFYITTILTCLSVDSFSIFFRIATFTMTMEVPSEVLQKLVCENCDGYLSRGPVHLMENLKYRCGRCLPSGKEKSTRIEVYEELANLMTFPCRYQENGCSCKVPFVENEAHEEACQYRKYICPIAESGQCEWTGIQTELLQHCRQHHPDNIVRNPCKFTHNITRSSLHNYLLWTLGVLFLIQTKVCTISRKIYHSVRLIGDPASAADYKYTLCIQNKDSKFYKERQVAPREYLALQNDSSIQTDINGLLTMLQDFTDTTFTITIESVGNETVESSSANTLDDNRLEVTVVCDTCNLRTKPVYRGGWQCRKHAPQLRPCKNSNKGCTYSDVSSKCTKHECYYCQHSTRCWILSKNITSTTLDAHYTEAHGDITHRADTVCSVRPVFSEKYLIIECDVGRTMCRYCLCGSDFVLWLLTPLPSEQLYKYRCAVVISHPNTGHTLTCTSTVRFGRMWDWDVRIPLCKFNNYAQNDRVDIKINIIKAENTSQIVL